MRLAATKKHPLLSAPFFPYIDGIKCTWWFKRLFFVFIFKFTKEYIDIYDTCIRYVYGFSIGLSPRTRIEIVTGLDWMRYTR